ncbi:flagellar hook-associated protein 1 FlgK [Microbacterium sp. ru370.1]|uniref:flagellar hook-associated protein FlgK n=1 Tax=unclassified Microbacterium TaxID=2609290 RepID=UPI000880E20F|nr:MULTISPECIES: flagellar hook-associated protein FlgK [unclassified Microbacterium]SDO54582.1 flagellar hook-associated protein 1 FlgK [Microbacterium sp. ru370.1]SIT84607.1 flagellar hook-associated protein 1 FlgK [Microbacterium sp. RU1D]
MSTFAGLQVAASGLAAARAGMNVTGQNIANETTTGYTRQRIDQTSVAAPGTLTAWGSGLSVGGGVAVTGIARLGDEVLDARVRDALSASGFWATRAAAAGAAEAVLAEPTKDGLAANLNRFWAGWSDLANTPEPAAAQVVLTNASVLAAQIASGYDTVVGQWTDLRAQVDRQIADVNVTAAQVATLNGQIRTALQSGRSANELIDQRNVLAQQLSTVVGATGRLEDDGTMTLRLDGNALVAGDSSRALTVTGPREMTDPTRMTVSWTDRPDVPVAVTGGSVGGALSVLAPASEGGTLAAVADAYNAVATALATAVNGIHRSGQTATGAGGGDFFSLDATGPAARGLRVVPTGLAQLALAAPGAGALDTSIADRISVLGTSATGPSATWSSFVTGFGVAVGGDVQRADTADRSAIAAISGQQSQASVDGDEETINLLKYQTAYQAAARVLTAVDEALDLLINRVGLVGR